MPTLTVQEQHEAYSDGYREGTLVKFGYKRLSFYVTDSVGDFPLGSYGQQNGQGYVDAIKGFVFNFLPWRVER